MRRGHGAPNKIFKLRSRLFPPYNNHSTGRITNMTPDYKEEKKSSVTDLQGGGIWEINILTFLAPVRPRLISFEHRRTGI